eukprot:scaffold7160_cov142-Cylindrotheca_fusiformis.AAC.1
MKHKTPRTMCSPASIGRQAGNRIRATKGLCGPSQSAQPNHPMLRKEESSGMSTETVHPESTTLDWSRESTQLLTIPRTLSR